MRKNFTRTLLLPVFNVLTAGRKLYSFFLFAVLLFGLQSARAQGVCTSSTQIFSNASVPSTLVNNTFTNQGYNVGALSAYSSFPNRQMATWVYCVVTKTGVINMNFGNTANGDFDWGVWGPFAPGRTIAEICASKMDNLPPILVDNTTGPGLSGSVTPTQVGQIYIILMLNWPLITTNCNLNFSGTGSIVPIPAITSFTPAAAANGSTVTISGTNFIGATAVSFGGTAAASFTVVNATTITAVVPANASGTINVTTPAGTGTSTSSFTITPQTPPGNALNFDGTGDYVAVPASTAFSFGTGDFTIESWIKLTTSGVFIAAGRYDGTGNDYWLGTVTGKAAFSISGSPVTGATTVNDGKWHHIAGTRSAGTIRIYVDGVQDGSLANSLGASPTGEFRVGAFFNNSTSQVSYYFPGSIDEVRVYKTALSAANIKSDMVSTASASPANLVLYYNFDEGISSANNASITTAIDQSGNNIHGTLTTFTLNGATSNWMESYAMVVPTATTATSISGQGFTANWTAPAIGIVTNYLLDVSTNPTFSSFVAGYNGLVVSGTSTVVSGLNISTTYYYRLRADKSSVTGQGAYGASQSLTTLSVAAPTVTSASPTTNIPIAGTTITINGTNFTGATSVSIGGVSRSFTVVSSTQITATLPLGGQGSVLTGVSVTAPGGTISNGAITFTYASTPTLNAASYTAVAGV
jgi:hypothetical protein